MRKVRKESEIIADWHEGLAEIMVSISCLTYNHENFIKDSLDGFLIQKTNFAFEILIHDDASTDRTADIIREYTKLYPTIIKPIYQSENQWANRWVIRNAQYGRMQGRYIAMCEGDDYWTDPFKLQKQVDFLDSNPEFMGCGHNVSVIYEDGRESHLLYGKEKLIKPIQTLEDVIEAHILQTCSVMYRNHIVKEFPSWFYKCAVGDWPLAVLHAERGPLAYMDEVMACYRLHSGGIWYKGATPEMMEKLEVSNCLSAIRVYKEFNTYFRYKHHKLIKRQVSALYWRCACAFQKAGIWSKAVWYAGKSLFLDPLNKYRWGVLIRGVPVAGSLWARWRSGLQGGNG